MKITVYGDSILKGVRLEDGRYRVDRQWERRLAEDHRIVIENSSHFGCTIEKALERIRRDCAAPGERGDVAVLEFGGNDCDYDWAAIAADPAGEYLCKTPPERFRARYKEALELLRRSGREPVVVNLPPIHSARYLRFICRGGLSRENILRWLGDEEAIFRWQESYSALVEQIAREEGAELIDVRSPFLSDEHTPEEKLCLDGIHPSRLGQGIIYGALSAAMG